MSDLGPDGNFEDDDDLLVAEYVLGVLDAPAREDIARRIAAEPDLARRARAWEERLSGLNSAFAEVTPPAGSLERLERRLFAAETPAPWHERLAFWRSAALGAAAIAILSIGLQVSGFLQPAEPRVVQTASLAAPEAGVSFIALYDPETDLLHLSSTGASAPTGSDYELWAIPADEAPISLGVIAAAVPDSRTVAPPIRARFVEGLTLAVSIEPAGGSTTGAPTGPVIATAPIASVVL